MHDKVDTANRESRGNIRIEYSVPIRSLRLGLIGKADVVEYHRMDDGIWMPFPVEYKRGKPKIDNCDKVQICAQALCLEEMLDVEVPSGALFYGKKRRRTDVVFDSVLRQQTEDAAMRLHELIESGRTPKPVYTAKCDSCSLMQICLPKTIGRKRSVKRYLSGAIRES
jgi:CRISPR-associated exonuclease Cas4